MEEYELVIGLEVHVELLTDSKMFCGCSTKFGAPPNSQICPVCTGFPGVLPVINRKAVELAMKAAIALNCKISPFSRFARKHYFYPDLPKNYQISQYEEPLATEGVLLIDNRNIRIRRIHLEEDAGKLIHPEDNSHYSLVDLNRSGVPLIEIVTEPDIRSSSEAEKFLTVLKRILEYLEVSDCNMEEGSLRCDANISVRRYGDERFGVKTEIKNMNSFRAVRKALEYEARRQISCLREGQALRQETRLWNENLQITEEMRRKEETQDYRYFPEPDLPSLVFDNKIIEEISVKVGELPFQRKERFVREYMLSDYDAEVLTSKKDIADYFESCVEKGGRPKIVANWIMGDLTALLKSAKKEIGLSPVSPEYLIQIVSMIEDGKITGVVAKSVLQECFNTGVPPEKIVSERNLLQIEDDETISNIVKEVIAENTGAVQDYKGGKEEALSFLIGQIMRKTKGKANPAAVRNKLLEYLNKK
ncbi:MAG TPA: Asp-tRNA(Asn)/Glu-tRNA(Gln) amidotransferase subunit GatB [bacterium]|nr:Asp-tRNA(Asn)/Glu-tRNA(Gln) amidotransferase subunit GatB [bacterium]HPP29381.1 Asp-tRNA(Asn)/Glu-tRNA(Gln) amidotransferase subunit GatB [bacterium]